MTWTPHICFLTVLEAWLVGVLEHPRGGFLPRSPLPLACRPLSSPCVPHDRPSVCVRVLVPPADTGASHAALGPQDPNNLILP